MSYNYSGVLKVALIYVLSLGTSSCISAEKLPLEKTACCELPDGSFSYQTSSQCKKGNGVFVSNLLCEQPVSICCGYKNGTTVQSTALECHQNGGAQLPLAECQQVPVSLCCELADGSFSYQLDSFCIKPNGIPADLVQCQETCCQLSDGSYDTLSTGECESVQGTQVSADFCHDCLDDICCQLPDGSFDSLPENNCSDLQGTAVADNLCIDTCCQLPDGTVQTLSLADCEKQNGVELSGDQCSGTCCLLPNGDYSDLTLSQCTHQQGSPANADFCVDTCCEVENVFFTTESGNCPNTLPVDACEEICCKQDTGFNLIPAGACNSNDIVDDAMCVPDVCCKDADGGFQLLPPDQCVAPLQVVASNFCQPEETICCRVGIDYIDATPTECTTQGGVQSSQDFCDTIVCCEQADGSYQNQNAGSCDPGQTVDDLLCSPLTDTCKKFRAIDMLATSLPYTTTGGVTLQSATGSGPWVNPFTLTNPWSGPNQCLDTPMGIYRIAIGEPVAPDGYMVFANPVTEFYIMTYAQNFPGDTVVVVTPSTITPTTCNFISPNGIGGTLYGGKILKITLDTPSTMVHLKDVDPGGGSGYSFTLAECID